jgi:hypothetical protein
MDDILKKAMFEEVADVLAQVEEIAEKYKHSGELVYSTAFAYLEEEGENENKWTLAYGHNCSDSEEFEQLTTLQIAAFHQGGEEDEIDLPGLFLN